MEKTPNLDYLEFLGLFISCELMQGDLIFLFGYEGLIKYSFYPPKLMGVRERKQQETQFSALSGHLMRNFQFSV